MATDLLAVVRGLISCHVEGMCSLAHAEIREGDTGEHEPNYDCKVESPAVSTAGNILDKCHYPDMQWE